MSNCHECKNLRCYRGGRDRYGVPQEPDEYECKVIEELTEEEADRFFSNAESWESPEDGCSGFVMIDWEDFQ